MYLKYNETNYPCKCSIGKEYIIYSELPEDFPSPITGEISIYSDNNVYMQPKEKEEVDEETAVDSTEESAEATEEEIEYEYIVEEIPEEERLLRTDIVEDYLRQTFINGKLTLTNIPEPVIPEVSLETLKERKLAQISKTCNATIVAGVDVETTQGTEHFSLEETDQINLNAALTAISQGATAYPYHADKQLCRMFTAEEIMAVVQAGTQHKVYHTTLCNHLLVWVRRVETKEELEAITYSAENLPEDLAANMQSILNN